jgi:hypothetical protein
MARLEIKTNHYGEITVTDLQYRLLTVLPDHSTDIMNKITANNTQEFAIKVTLTLKAAINSLKMMVAFLFDSEQ